MVPLFTELWTPGFPANTIIFRSGVPQGAHFIREWGRPPRPACPKVFHCGVPQGAHFIREWGARLTPSSTSGFSSCSSAAGSRSNPTRIKGVRKSGGGRGIKIRGQSMAASALGPHGPSGLSWVAGSNPTQYQRST